MKQLIKIFACTLILTNSQFVFAEITGYEVEVIIFSYNNNQYLNSENWPDIEPASTKAPAPSEKIVIPNKSEASDIEKHIKTDGGDNQPIIDLTKQASFLNKDQYRLTTQAQKIQTQQHYKLLYHKAWKQAGLAEDQAFPIHIDSRQKKNNTDTQVQTITAAPPETSKDKNVYIEGNITLIMSRYLHIQTDLLLHKPEIEENINKPDETESLPALEQLGEKRYRINLERRMKSREIHFVDHPLIGILILATPFKISEPGDELENTKTQKYKIIN